MSRRPGGFYVVGERIDAAWQQAVDAFIGDCQDRNLAEPTWRGYQRALECRDGAIGTWRRELGVERVSDVTEAAMAAFRRVARECGLKPRAVVNRHNDLSCFARWLWRHGYDVEPEACMVEPPELPESDPDVYEPSERAAIALASRCDRDDAIIAALLATGIRPSEFCRLDVADLVDDERATEGPYLLVRQGKGRRSRVVPLDPEPYALVRRYIDELRPRTTSPALFVTLIPNPTTRQYERLTYWGLRSMHRRLRDRAQTGKRVYAYKARHSFATTEVLGGTNREVVQRVMGQRRRESLDPYLRITGTDVVRAWNRRRQR